VTPAAERVCVALDFASRPQVLAAAERFGGRVGWLKIGLEAFVAEGPSLVAECSRFSSRIFLDLKFHDIPRTVGRAVSAACRAGAAMVNVHASGGRAMLRAARDAAAGSGAKVVAVTLLTSLDAAALADLPIVGRPEAIAGRLALLAQQCGLDGVVCSPADLETVRAACGKSFLTVVPGIRPAGVSVADQRRVGTPAAAVEAGADVLVIGRPVTEAPDPDAALAGILSEIESVVSR
jgi:orotidine-5'-phosphate decarboxylase